MLYKSSQQSVGYSIKNNKRLTAIPLSNQYALSNTKHGLI